MPPMDALAPPSLSPLCRLEVTVGPPVELGRVADGVRRIIPITGGTVTGVERAEGTLSGVVLPGGADFQVLRSDTLTELEARDAVETEDGERIWVTNLGIRTGEAQDIAALVRGESVPHDRIYFRCTPRMQSSGPRWAWLAGRILVGTGRRTPDAVHLDISWSTDD